MNDQINPEDTTLLKNIKDIIEQGRIDEAVSLIGGYLNKKDEDYIKKLEDLLERISSVHGGDTVIRFLIENLIIDIPSLLENLSKRDQLLRYSFLLLLKNMCENESDLFLPYSEELLESDDPNVREAILQLIIFIANGPEKIEKQPLVCHIAETLDDPKEYVVEKAAQALKAIGKDTPSLVTKALSDYIREIPETEEYKELRKQVDTILKSIVSVEKIDEIVEEEEKKAKEKEAEGVSEILEEKSSEQKEVLKEEERPSEGSEGISGPISSKEQVEVETEEEKEFKQIEKEIQDEEKDLKKKDLELKKKDLELKKKKLELEEKEKELEEKQIQEKEEALKQKEELLEKEKALQQVELELQKKTIEDKQKEILNKEAERVQKRLENIEKKTSNEQENLQNENE